MPTLAAEIFRKIQARRPRARRARRWWSASTRRWRITSRRTERDGLERLQALIGRKIVVQAVPSYHREQYERDRSSS